ncbi:hypothetical protein PT974_03775 [Cladobotryum mycophilum]|uniref:Protein kinase domain-containing protein n=1 Tax=Cladobotryum mycophilum TaxID=491253 RepID=A0ABR0SUD7_9HYPO
MEEFYPVGQILPMTFFQGDEQTKSTIRVRILKHYTQTCSCAMRVEILDHPQGPGQTAFLKLYDRRFATGLRGANGVEKWTKDIEQSFIEFAQDGPIQQFLQRMHLNPDDFLIDLMNSWTHAQGEAFLYQSHLRFFNEEKAAYARLKSCQGSMIPELFGSVELSIALPDVDAQSHNINSRDVTEFFKVKGLLMQHINGCSLWEMGKYCPQEDWQDIVDEAISVVDALGKYDMINSDVHPTNVMISLTSDSTSQRRYGVYMIDFAYCEFRKEDQSDAEWEEAKRHQDEIGAVGMVMKNRLSEKFGFKLRFDRSEWLVECSS